MAAICLGLNVLNKIALEGKSEVWLSNTLKSYRVLN